MATFVPVSANVSTDLPNDIHSNENKTCMHGLIRQARYCLEEFMNPQLAKEQGIPFQVLDEAKGIVFLTILKGGLGVGGAFGTGIVISRNKEDCHQWNGPIAIALNGLQLGFNIGIEQSEHIIILNNEQDVEAFVSNAQFRVEGDVSIALGTMGRDTNIALSVNEKRYISTPSYSLSKGAYIGISMEGQAISIQKDCNDEYFGDNINPLDVFKGTVKPLKVDEEYTNLCQTLNKYIFTQKCDFLSPFIKQRTENKVMLPGLTTTAPTTTAATTTTSTFTTATTNTTTDDKSMTTPPPLQKTEHHGIIERD